MVQMVSQNFKIWTNSQIYVSIGVLAPGDNGYSDTLPFLFESKLNDKTRVSAMDCIINTCIFIFAMTMSGPDSSLCCAPVINLLIEICINCVLIFILFTLFI